MSPPPSPRSPDRDVSLIAHRGCAEQAPENTIAAVEAAAPHVDAIEIDVRPCGTGEIVVFHDETLDRVTDGTGRVDETPLAALRELDVLASGERVPTLREMLAAVTATPEPVTLDVELKAAGIERRVHEQCAAADVDVRYSSFREAALRRLRRIDPDASLAVLCDRLPAMHLTLASALDAVAIHPSKTLVRTTDVVPAAAERGLTVNAWTVRTTSEAERLVDAGVDGLIADRWDVLGTKDGNNT